MKIGPDPPDLDEFLSKPARIKKRKEEDKEEEEEEEEGELG